MVKLNNISRSDYPDALATAKTYDKYGEMYHASRVKRSGRFTNEFIDIPTTFSLLPKELSGLRILDAGWRSGNYSVRLAIKTAVLTER
jgi:hypothetical protein